MSRNNAESSQGRNPTPNNAEFLGKSFVQAYHRSQQKRFLAVPHRLRRCGVLRHSEQGRARRGANGQILGEVLIAIGVIAIVAASLATLLVITQQSQEAARRRDIAASLANEAFAAVHAIAGSDDATSQGYNRFYCPPGGTQPNGGDCTTPGPKGSAAHYRTVVSGGQWRLEAGDETPILLAGIAFTRFLTIQNVCRDASGTITGITDNNGADSAPLACDNTAALGDEEDRATQLITVTVSAPQMAATTVSQYLTRNRNVVSTQTDWSGGTAFILAGDLDAGAIDALEYYDDPADVNDAIFAGGSAGRIFRCATSTGCDDTADWVLVANFSTLGGTNALFIDAASGIALAGFANGTSPWTMISYCNLATLCDAAAEWQTPYPLDSVNQHTAIQEDGFIKDPVNNQIYAAAGGASPPSGQGDLYVCAVTSACDASGDWVLALDTPANNARGFVFDATENRLYAGFSTNTGAEVRVCNVVSAGPTCSGAEWTTSDDGPGTNSLGFDTINRGIFRGVHNADIWYCQVPAGGVCTDSDWALVYQTGQSSVESFAFDAIHGIIYAGTEDNAIIFYCEVGDGTPCRQAVNWHIAADLDIFEVDALLYDAEARALYAGTDSSAKIYKCAQAGICSAESPAQNFGNGALASSNMDVTVSGQLTLQSGAASGTLESIVLDTQAPNGAGFNAMLWSGSGSTGQVGLQLAASNSSDGPWTYMHPATCSTTSYAAPPPSTAVGVNTTCSSGALWNKRYFRYRVLLCRDSNAGTNTCTATIGSSPIVSDITVNWAK